jgi:hypothetical protein
MPDIAGHLTETPKRLIRNSQPSYNPQLQLTRLATYQKGFSILNPPFFSLVCSQIEGVSLWGHRRQKLACKPNLGRPHVL